MRKCLILISIIATVLAMTFVGHAAGKIVLYTQFIDEWWTDLYKQFGEETGIQLEMVPIEWGDRDKFATAYAGGAAPDVALFDSGVIVWAAENSMLMDQRPFWQRDKAVLNIDDFSPALLRAVGGDQGLAVPDNFDPYLVWFNRQVFSEAGLDDPPADWTYDDYFNYAKKITKGEGDTKFYGSVPLMWEVVAEAAGGEFVDANGKYAMNKPAVYEAIDWAYDLMYRWEVVPRWGVLSGSWHTWLPNLQVGMHWAGPWYQSRVAGTVDWGVALPPKGQVYQTTRLFVGGYVIPSTASNPQGAWEFIKWMHSDKVWKQRAKQFTHIPFKASLQRQKDLLYWQVFGEKWAPVLVQSMNLGRAMPFNTLAYEIQEILNSAIESGPESGEKSTKQAFEERQGEIDSLIAQRASQRK
mgnify:CR=1 FL=1